MTEICPCCRRSHQIKRNQIGALSTEVCDYCYWRRFANDPSEKAYFTRDSDFWNKIGSQMNE